MSVENKIKELLERVNVKASLEEADMMGASGVSRDSSIPPANSGDSGQPRQGSSEDASYEERDEKEPNQGAKVSKDVKKNDIQMKAPPGDAPNFTTVADPTSAVNQASSAGNVQKEETEEESDDTISEEEAEETVAQEIDLSPIFGEDLSEEFKSKAISIFEAAVIARVNNEMEKISEALEEKYASEVAEYKETIVEKIDAYLNYVVENWMDENKLAVENGLRTEIAEDFIEGLKVLFKEHYIEIPEEKYDVISELQTKVEELEESLNNQVSNNVELNSEVAELRKSLIIKEMSDDLADTEISKLNKLLEGVEFENEEIYTEKVRVIKENYFPANKKPEVSVQALIEETDTQATFSGNDTVASYAQALSRSIKRQ